MKVSEMNDAQRAVVLGQTIKKIHTRAKFHLAKTFPAVKSNHLTTEEKREMAKGVAMAEGKEFKEKKIYSEDIPETLEKTEVRYDSNELMVITRTKKLLAYVMTVMLKSPKYFRQTLVYRIQNYVIDALEAMVKANSIRADTAAKKAERKRCQHEAYTSLKLLDYMSFIALENGCITRKQYLQIALQLSDCINLLVAWTKKT